MSFVEDDSEPGAGMATLKGTLHHLSTFWAQREEPNIALFHYADLQADLEGEFRRDTVLEAFDGNISVAFAGVIAGGGA